jgi:hypothetical protein
MRGGSQKGFNVIDIATNPSQCEDNFEPPTSNTAVLATALESFATDLAFDHALTVLREAIAVYPEKGGDDVAH